MSINVKESTMVSPAEDTPRETLWLSKLDMTIRTPYSHTNVLFLYKFQSSTLEKNSNKSNFFDTKILKEALSKALVPFYPMAGRLKYNDENGRYEIDCNAKGALFIEAESSTLALADYGDYLSLDSQLRKLVMPTCDYSMGLSSFPLLLVQLTRFNCGNVCLGFAHHHHVADGTSHLHFNNLWARLAKGLDINFVPLPVHDRSTYLAPRNPPQVMFQHLEYDPPLPPLFPKTLSGEVETATTECMFKLTKEQINTLKTQATSQDSQQVEIDEKLSTFEVLAGHVWRSVCMARGLTDDQDAKLFIVVNGRPGLKDIVPQGYCGNLLFYAAWVDKVGNITKKPLWYAARKIHESIKKTKDVEYLRSAIDFVESELDLTASVGGIQNCACPSLNINSWARLPLYEMDFGWGEPMFAGINGIKKEGLTFITSDADGNFSMAIKLFTPHMSLFETFLYNF